MKISIEYGYLDHDGNNSTKVILENNGRKVSATFNSSFDYETKESIQKFIKRLESSINQLIELTNGPLEKLLEDKQ